MNENFLLKLCNYIALKNFFKIVFIIYIGLCLFYKVYVKSQIFFWFLLIFNTIYNYFLKIFIRCIEIFWIWMNQYTSNKYINFKDNNLWLSIISTILVPLVWNLIARYEYKNKVLQKVFKDKYRACYIFGIFILKFTLKFRFFLIAKSKNLKI